MRQPSILDGFEEDCSRIKLNMNWLGFEILHKKKTIEFSNCEMEISLIQ
jgi:hypothetical protein